MFHVSFSLYQIRVSISATSEACLEKLAKDFAYFSPRFNQGTLPETSFPRIHLRILSEKAQRPSLPFAKASKVTSHYVTYRSENQYTVDYQGKAILQYRTEPNVLAFLYCPNPELQHELSYLFLSSQIGLQLDRAGYHRIHALGFSLRTNSISTNGTSMQPAAAGLLLIPSGGGKSTLALELLKSKEINLLSDDSPLVSRSGRLLPFPLRLGFSAGSKLPPWANKPSYRLERRLYGTKILVPTDALPWPPQKNIDARGMEPKILVIAERWGENHKPMLQQVPRWRALVPVFRDMVLGLGLPQLAEIILNVSLREALRFIPIGFSRSLAAIRLCFRSKVFILRLSSFSSLNAELLLDQLNHEAHSQ